MRTVRTTVTVPEHVWRMLRALAEARAEGGERRSASAVVAELVEREARKPRPVKGDAA